MLMKLPRGRSCLPLSLQFAARTKSVLKRSLFALILPGLMAGSVAASQTVIPVLNGDFESINGTTNLPNNWTFPDGTSFLASSVLRFHSSGHSLKIIDTSASLPGSVRSTAIPVIEGRLYTGKIWANLDTATGGGVTLYLEFWNSQNMLMITYSKTISSPLDTWTQISTDDPTTGARPAPHGSAYCTLRAYSQAGYTGTVFFDDASLEVKDIPFSTAGVAVDDPGMEGGTGSGLPPAWVAYSTNNYEFGSTALFLRWSPQRADHR